MKNKIYLSIIIALSIFILGELVIAQNENNFQQTKLDYKGDLILDNDLDGLTDLGEKEIFKTNPLSPDSDGDGFYDGVEVIGGTDPLDNTSPAATKTINTKVIPVEKDIPWPWYISRASGLIAFILLYLVMFFGLSIRMPLLKRIMKPITSLNIHAWLSVQALMFVFIHGGVLIFDKFINLKVADVTVPFVSDYYKNEIALGIIGMYLMVILILTSYFRNKISHALWRFVHYFNIVLYVAVVIHALVIGTDLKNDVFRYIFLYANFLLILMIIINIISRIVEKIRAVIRLRKKNDSYE